MDLTHASIKMTDNETGQQDTLFSPILVNYGVNVDFLGNFVVTESVDFGGFVGVGIGGNTWTGKDIEDMKKADSNTKTTSFDLSLNVGLRTNIATNHGIELAFRVPFLKTQLRSPKDTNGADIKLGQNFRVLARYTFSF